MASASRQLSRLSLLAVLAAAGVYALAVGTRWGLHLDAGAIPRGASGPNWDRAHAALRHAIDTIHLVTIALAGCAAVMVALRRGRRDLAAVAAATLVGANLTTQLLKPLLGRADPFGGEAAREIASAFPSGHATAAMSLALVAVVVAPRRLRGWVALAAAGYAGTIGVGLVVRVWHYPSDVVGGFLVAGAWAAAMSAVALARREDGDRAPAVPRLPRPPIASWALPATAAAIAAGLLLREPGEHLHRGLFAVAALAIASLALLLPAVLTVVLGRGRAQSR
ncbi:MAG TPA: phosphatase PAP2 family protein [Thermoleophilaceae bacterium]